MMDVSNLPPVRKGDMVTLDTGERYESNGNGQIQYYTPSMPCDFIVNLRIEHWGIPVSYRRFVAIHRNGVLVWSFDMPRQLSLFDAPQTMMLCEFCDTNPATVVSPDGDNVCQGCYERELA